MDESGRSKDRLSDGFITRTTQRSFMEIDIVLDAETIECAACGTQIERGYAPATTSETGHVIRDTEAVCDVCGFNDIGFTGCAPELSDFTGDGDVLVSFAFDEGLSDARITDQS